jgi:hypothetical protein
MGNLLILRTRILFLIFLCLFFLSANAQKTDKLINVADVTSIEEKLSANDMQGRKTFTPGIEKGGKFYRG